MVCYKGTLVLGLNFDMRIWRNWQTRMVQVHVRALSWRFKSSYPHHVGAKFALFRLIFYKNKVIRVGTDFAPFFYAEKPPPASLLLLIRRKVRSARLLACKRAHNGKLSLPLFCDIAPSAQPKSPAATAFMG